MKKTNYRFRNIKNSHLIYSLIGCYGGMEITICAMNLCNSSADIHNAIIHVIS